MKTQIISLDSKSILHLCKHDKRLERVIETIGPIEYYVDRDPFSFMVHEIIEQMLSKKSAETIYSRFQEICDGVVTPQIVSRLSIIEIRNSGTSTAKAKYIKNLAEIVSNGDLDFESLSFLSDQEIIKKLTNIQGIGTWTAKMYLIFVLCREDILPFEDGAFLQSYRWLYNTEDCSRTAIIKKCKKWKPYSAIAARYLYQALDQGLTKEKFHLFKGRTR